MTALNKQDWRLPSETYLQFGGTEEEKSISNSTKLILDPSMMVNSKRNGDYGR